MPRGVYKRKEGLTRAEWEQRALEPRKRGRKKAATVTAPKPRRVEEPTEPPGTLRSSTGLTDAILTVMMVR